MYKPHTESPRVLSHRLKLLHIDISFLISRVGMLFTVLAIQNCPTTHEVINNYLLLGETMSLPILIYLDAGDDNVAGIDANRNRSTV